MSANVVTTSSPPETSARFVVPDRTSTEARGVDPSWARKAYERGEKPYRREHVATLKERQFAVALYRSGLSLRSVAEYHERVMITVRRWVRQAGIDTAKVGHDRQKAPRIADRGQRVYELRFVQGWEWPAICATFGLPEWNRNRLGMAARRYAQKNGLTMERSA